MPIRTRFEVKVDKRRLKKSLEDGGRQFGEGVGRVMRDTADDVRTGFLADVANYPTNKPSSPFVWSTNRSKNEKARRWWFAAVDDNRVETDGSHYVRSNELAKGWEITSFSDPKSSEFEIAILARGSTNRGGFKHKWVVGTFDQRDGAKWQIRGHQRTGWYLINDIAAKWFNFTLDRVDDFAKAVTRRNR